MGYSTDFFGDLKFKNAPSVAELQKLNEFFDEDCREHPEWGNTNLSYIDLELNDDMSGIRWNGAEKTYDLTEKVNLVIKLMKNDFPDFGLVGELIARGEDRSDNWKMVIDETGFAKAVKI